MLLRNLILVAVVYLGPALGVYIQAHIVFLIMVVSLLLHAYTRPFKEPIIDNMEFVSIGRVQAQVLRLALSLFTESHYSASYACWMYISCSVVFSSLACCYGITSSTAVLMMCFAPQPVLA